jgi:hypothetical protein
MPGKASPNKYAQFFSSADLQDPAICKNISILAQASAHSFYIQEAEKLYHLAKSKVSQVHVPVLFSDCSDLSAFFYEF